MFLAATASHTGAVAVGVVLVVIGLVVLLDIGRAASRYRNLLQRLGPGPPLWLYRGVGLLGVLGGIVVIVLAVG